MARRFWGHLLHSGPQNTECSGYPIRCGDRSLKLCLPGRRIPWHFVAITFAAALFSGCNDHSKASSTSAAGPADNASKPESPLTVGVVRVERKAIGRELTVSSELVPFQEIDIFAKESGFVRQLLVDYGTHVQKGQLIAVLEIPELEMQLDQDRATERSQQDEITYAQQQLARTEAQHQVVHLQYERLAGVAKAKPGLVAQQEVDDLQGRDLAAEAQVQAGRSSVAAARSNLAVSQAKSTRDQALFDYSRINAPFSGVVTQRYANLGTLLASGTNSSTQAMPVVKLSELDLFRLVIPVSEAYVRYVKVGDAVKVFIPSLDETLAGKVARFSHDVHDATRTMHTEVDIANLHNDLIPGLYAEATISLNRAGDAAVIPLQGVSRESAEAIVAVVDKQGRVQMRHVVLGIETENEAEVLSGLEAGDEVIVSDRAGLTAGQHVKAQLAPPLTYTSKG